MSQYTPEQINAFEEYEKLKIQEKEIAARLDDLKLIIMEAVPVEVEVKGSLGVFTVQRKAKYIYTDKVKQYELNLKQLKKDEEATGDAEVEYSTILYYRTNKKSGE